MKLDKIPERLDANLDLEKSATNAWNSPKTRLLFCRCRCYSGTFYGRGH